jgi:hypothetical protein
MVNELTRPHEHREHHQIHKGKTWYGVNHITTVPSLLWQLDHAAPSGTGDDRSSAGYESRPTARLEALDCLIHIDLEASRWVRDLGEDDPLDTAGCVTLLHGLARSHPESTRAIEHDVRRWWTQARIVTGLDSPAWRPDNTCPLCGVKGGLRVKLMHETGFCTHCLETWTPETIGLLANHIRAENQDEMPSEDAG